MTKRLSVSLVHKTVTAFLALFFLYPLVAIFTGIEEAGSQAQTLAFAVLGMIFAFFFYQSFRTFSFGDDRIEAKLPFLKPMVLKTEAITGWYVNPGTSVSTYTFVTKRKNLSVYYSGKLRTALDAYVESISETLAEGSFQDIQAHGLTIYGLFSRPVYQLDDQGILVVKTGQKIPWDQVSDIRTTTHGTLTGYEVDCPGPRIRFTNIGARGCPGLTRYLREKLG